MAITINRPGAHRSTNRRTTSPPTSNASNPDPRWATASTADGCLRQHPPGDEQTVELMRGTDHRSGTTTSRSPCSNAPENLPHREIERQEWNWVHTCAPAKPGVAIPSDAVKLWWVIATPGSRSVPEVQIRYAISGARNRQPVTAEHRSPHHRDQQRGTHHHPRDRNSAVVSTTTGATCPSMNPMRVSGCPGSIATYRRPVLSTCQASPRSPAPNAAPTTPRTAPAQHPAQPESAPTGSTPHRARGNSPNGPQTAGDRHRIRRTHHLSSEHPGTDNHAGSAAPSTPVLPPPSAGAPTHQSTSIPDNRRPGSAAITSNTRPKRATNDSTVTESNTSVSNSTRSPRHSPGMAATDSG